MTSVTIEKNRNILWRLFSSVKLTIVLLILLAVACIVGTLIPQATQSQMESTEFAMGLSPELLRFFIFLDLFDLYHSILFRSLIGCLSANLIICSINRFPGTWGLFRAKVRPDREKPFEALPPHQVFLTKGDISQVSEKISLFLKSHYKNAHTKTDTDRHFYYAEKGGYSRFGVYIVHTSVLLILIGALIGSFFGFEGFVNITEGDQIDTVNLNKGYEELKRALLNPSSVKSHPHNYKKEDDILNLGFGVRCDKFTVDFYENGMPKEYKSELTFVSDGKEVDKKSLMVNHPVQFRGVTFYQASYGQIPGKNVRLKIVKNNETGHAFSVETEVEAETKLPGNEGLFAVTGVKTNFMNTGPAVQIAVKPFEGEEVLFWVFEGYDEIRKKLPGPMLMSPKFSPSAFKPYTFILEGLDTIYYTGLQVNRDPGVPIVYLGFCMIIAGFIITFFASHRRIWVRALPDKKGISVSIAGTSSRDQVGLERELMHLTNGLKAYIEG
ncbi:ResB-like protein [uncultured Desulfobacterium sp.]|uniref:ResB-like protein n=1 Tax=uncultured Desulfobacterium sp. TaxID=201089 RepID=A0A445MZF1_9BACT|nr:ResB-like protein [uncultured Desulfobacterium sp.]